MTAPAPELRRRARVAVGLLLATAIVFETAALVLLAVAHLGRPVLVTPLGTAAAGSRHAQRDDQSARQLARLAPRGTYIVIDTYGNRLQVFRGSTLLRDAVCSTGSGSVLVDPAGHRRWTFDTPLGERTVRRKVHDPVWSKPDWAFIEEGFSPPQDPRLRTDDFSLGAYGLYLGDGYIIHGTLFQTLLGRGVTHGCVRLGDEDLEYVYRTVPLGSRVYLY